MATRVPNSTEGGLSDKAHIDEAEYYAEGEVDGVNVERARRRANPDTGRYDTDKSQRRSKDD